MKAERHNFSIALLLILVMVGCVSCQSTKETRVSLLDLSPAARATLEKVTAGGTIEKIDREIERGRVVYDAEASVGGKHVEYLIAESDGEVLGTETEIPFSQLPESVRVAAEKYFGTSTGLKAMKGVEYGETHFEIEAARNGKTTEMTFDPLGKTVK